MNPREKLVLIRECVAHVDEYKPQNKTAFWNMICKLLKDETGYNLQELRVTVTRWVKAHINELVEKEMGFGTQVKQDNFKEAVEKFGEQIDAIKKNLDSAVKDKRI